MNSTRARESLRRSFRPDVMRLLFIGEAPPASGRFFYQGDSGLYRAMRDVFHLIDPKIDDTNFLKTFQEAGCYLIDLCGEPVDHLDRRTRREFCGAREPRLAKTIGALAPQTIATLLRSIEGNVARAAAAGDWHGPFLHLPYPGRWIRHRAAFTEALLPVLRDVMRQPKMH